MTLAPQSPDSRSGMPRVDVGIPTLGQRAYVHEAIASVLAQTFTSWRLIVSVNDVARGEDFSRYDDHPRIEILRTAEPLGAYGNKNVIARASTAPYLAFLDDDDLWEPEFLQRRVQALDEHPQCAFAFSTYTEIDAEGRRTSRGPEPFAPAGVLTQTELLQELLAPPSERRIYTIMLTTLVRRSAFEAVGPAFDETLPIIGDYELWLRLASRYPAVFLHTWDAAYRRHPGQDSQSARLGAEFLAVHERLDSILGSDLAYLKPGAKELERQRADWLFSQALDGGGAGARRRAASAFVAVAGSSPRYLVDARLPAVLGTVVLGRAMTPVLRPVRSYLRRRSLRKPT
jgi:glycosyltransferase involved in cell wall biosynthesis